MSIPVPATAPNMNVPSMNSMPNIGAASALKGAPVIFRDFTEPLAQCDASPADTIFRAANFINAGFVGVKCSSLLATPDMSMFPADKNNAGFLTIEAARNLLPTFGSHYEAWGDDLSPQMPLAGGSAHFFDNAAIARKTKYVAISFYADPACSNPGVPAFPQQPANATSSAGSSRPQRRDPQAPGPFTPAAQPQQPQQQPPQQQPQQQAPTSAGWHPTLNLYAIQASGSCIQTPVGYVQVTCTPNNEVTAAVFKNAKCLQSPMYTIPSTQVGTCQSADKFLDTSRGSVTNGKLFVRGKCIEAGPGAYPNIL